MTLAQALAAAAALGVARLDAQLLLLHALDRQGSERAWLLAHDADELAPHTDSLFMQLCRRRLAGEPVAYLTGHKEFFGLNLGVDARVLVPRPETETLVEWALSCHSGLDPESRGAPLRVLDLGTGSGAIALALKSTRPELEVTAVDISDGALAVARSNARRLRLEVLFQRGSWFDGLQRRFDLVVANPPYVAAGDPHLRALGSEPVQALVSGPDGLDAIREIVRGAANHLETEGWLLVEHGHDQAAAVRALLCGAGFGAIATRRDLAGIERCTGGKLGPLG